MTDNSNDLTRLPATAITRMVKAREVSAREVLDAVFDRIDKLDSQVNAFCTLTRNLAYEQADTVQKAIAAGQDPGPLAGVPVSIKDLISTAGVRTVGGSSAYAEFVPDEDDVTVERLRDSGALCLGKTNVPEFGYSGVGHNSVFPTTRNPWDIERTPGGSSAGCGAAVAAGMGPLSLGSDGGGSVRIPAAHCGLVGMKASWGRVPLYPGCRDPRYPGFSSWESLEHIGPITRTVGDAALMLGVIAGPDARDRHSVPGADVDWATATQGRQRPLRVALSLDLGYAAVDPRVKTLVEQAAATFEQLGHHVDRSDPGWDDPLGDFWAIVAAETDLVGMRQMVREHGETMLPHLKAFIDKPWTAEDFTTAAATRKRVANRMAAFMRDYDLLLTPTLTVPPFAVHVQGPEQVDGRIVDPFAWLSFTLPFNLTGNPAISVPAGFTPDGLPVGIQLVGRHLDDATVLAAAAAYEAANPWADHWPHLLDAN